MLLGDVEENSAYNFRPGCHFGFDGAALLVVIAFSRARSSVVKRRIRIAEAGVRFPPGPPKLISCLARG